MTALWITLGIIGGLLLIGLLLLFLGKAKLRIVCGREIKVVASILGIPFTLFSNEKQDEPEKELSRCFFPNLTLKKEMRRRKRQAEKARKKKLKQQQKKAQRAAKQTVSPNVRETVEMVFAIVKRVYAYSKGKLAVSIRKLHITVGTADAAKTAILHSLTVQSVGGLIAWLESHVGKVHRDPDDLQVAPDFVNGKCKVDIDIVCHMRVFRFLLVLQNAMQTYEEEHLNTVRKTKARLQKAKSKSEQKK